MSKPTPTFSMDQLVAELREALPDIDDAGVRTVKVAEALGLNVGLVILLDFIVEVLNEHLVGKPMELALGWFARVNIFDGLIPVLVGRVNLRPETVKPETGLIPLLVGRVNPKPETLKPET